MEPWGNHRECEFEPTFGIRCIGVPFCGKGIAIGGPSFVEKATEGKEGGEWMAPGIDGMMGRGVSPSCTEAPPLPPSLNH